MCQFNCIPLSLFKGLEHFGVLHTGEIPFVFNVQSLWSYDAGSDDAKTAMAVGKEWALFARTGKPCKNIFMTAMRIVQSML